MKYRIVKDNMYRAEYYSNNYKAWKSILSTTAYTKWGCKSLLNRYIKQTTTDTKIIEEFEI